jgi:hypothetical protein
VLQNGLDLIPGQRDRCFRYAMNLARSAEEMGRMRSSRASGYPSNLDDGQRYARPPSETPCILETPCKYLAPKIYVTEHNLASYTLLFARTAALVTDSGGVLSRSAVGAREYGTPAVVGTATASAVIRDGQFGRSARNRRKGSDGFSQ